MYRFITGIIIVAFGASAVAEGNPVRGQELTTTCMACHGPDGNSLAGAFPSIAGQNPKYLLKQMKDIKSGARQAPAMIGMLDNLSEQDMADIAAYYGERTIKGGAAKASLVKRGEVIYRAGIKRKQITACTACHSPTGRGNDPARFPALSGQWPEYVETQLKAFRAGSRTNDGDGGMMRSITMDMSDAEIAAVASYVYGLRD